MGSKVPPNSAIFIQSVTTVSVFGAPGASAQADTTHARPGGRPSLLTCHPERSARLCFPIRFCCGSGERAVEGPAVGGAGCPIQADFAWVGLLTFHPLWERAGTLPHTAWTSVLARLTPHRLQLLRHLPLQLVDAFSRNRRNRVQFQFLALAIPFQFGELFFI